MPGTPTKPDNKARHDTSQKPTGFLRPLYSPIPRPDLIITMLVLLLALCGTFYLCAPDMYVLDSQIASLRESYKVSVSMQRLLTKGIQNATAKVGANHAATVRIWLQGQNEQTTGVSGCLVTSEGAVLATSQLLGTTGSKCIVRYWSADYKNSEVSTYTVKVYDPDRELAILLPERHPQFTITFADIKTNPTWLELGSPVALGAVRQAAEHGRLTGGFFWYEMHGCIAADVPGTFVLLDRAIDPDMIGTPVFDAKSEIIGLAFGIHHGGEYFGESTSLVTLVSSGTKHLIEQLERDAELSSGTISKNRG